MPSAADAEAPAQAKVPVEAYGEDRGEGLHPYRFPRVFPSDHWQIVMPHELAAWETHDKRYWSEYAANGRVWHCMPLAGDSAGANRRRLTPWPAVEPR